MKWVAALALLGLFVCVQGYNDSQCTERDGICQTARRCDGGNYLFGFCGGTYRRRCCIPAGSSGCMRVEHRLACSLFLSCRVTAAQNHSSGHRDDAYAYNNLEDMCRGRRASSSSYDCISRGCYTSGGSTCLSYKLLNYLNDLARSGDVVINELVGACHSCNPNHYQGRAVDLHKNGRQSEYLRKCWVHGGISVNESNYVHCHFNP